MVRGDGSKAATADRGDASALRLDAPARLRVVGCGDEVFLTGANLQRQCALPRLGDELAGIEAAADLGSEAETVEPTGGEDDRVEAALTAFAQPCVDVPAQRFDRERRLEREQLRLAPDRRGADAHVSADLVRAAQGVPRILALEVGADRQAGCIRRRHVLRGVHRDVDPSVEQRFLELLDENAARADLAERAGAIAVARGRDRHEGDLDAGAP